MERAKWNGREYTASEIADDFEMEHTIRQLSRRELFCPDPQCETPLLRYCHGEKKHAYFAHLQTESCDYAQFDKQPGIIREVRYKLYGLFKSKGYDAQIEQKILPHHYTHILLKTETKTIAIEIGSSATRVAQIDTLQNDYSKIGIEDFFYRGITDETPMVDAFENIFRMLPPGIRSLIIRRMDKFEKGYWY